MKVIVILIVMLFSACVSAAPLTSIVAFGDSLSDNGNLYEFMHHQVPLSPPYYEGRFSNGPVWIEQLAKAYFPVDTASHLLDYAFGGAGISDDPDDEAIFTLKHEIDVYLLAHQDKADTQSLFTVWIGANNYLAIPDDVENTVQVVNNGIVDGVERLVKAGAKYILLVNLPDLGRTPAALEFDSQTQLSSLAKRHNQELAASFAVLQKKYPAIHWVYYDVGASFNNILNSPWSYGFNNTTGTCYGFMLGKSSHQSVLKMVSKVKEKAADEQCDGYLFFDPVHSTYLAHEIMANEVRNLLDAAGIEFAYP